jgi:hypothetical protein
MQLIVSLKINNRCSVTLETQCSSLSAVGAASLPFQVQSVREGNSLSHWKLNKRNTRNSSSHRSRFDFATHRLFNILFPFGFNKFQLRFQFLYLGFQFPFVNLTALGVNFNLRFLSFIYFGFPSMSEMICHWKDLCICVLFIGLVDWKLLVRGRN